MDKLPDELLSQILALLSPSDRLNVAPTCRRWAQNSALLKDIRLNIAGFEMDTAAAVLLRCHRPHMSLKLVQAALTDYNIDFWTKMSANLRELELNDCWWLPKVLYSILQQCSRLETLKLVDPERTRSLTSFEDLKLPEAIRAQEIRESLSHLRSLHLHIFLDKETLHNLLGLMPNVTSLHLSRLGRRCDFLTQLPVTNRMFLYVEFDDHNDEGFIDFIETYSGCIRELKLNGKSLPPDAYAAISQCSELRHLTLRRYLRLDDPGLEEVFTKTPNLETLRINGGQSLSDEVLAEIRKLKNLRRLDLTTGCCGTETDVTNEFLCGLGSMSRIQHLELRNSKVDCIALRSMASLKNLQSLFLDASHLDSECVEIICENFTTLKELSLGWIKKLTDADGVKLRQLSELRSLDFEGAYGFTDQTFENGLGAPAMQSLKMRVCPGLTDKALASIAAHHGRLKTLEISKSTWITDEGLVTLLEGETLLENLSVRYCDSLSDIWFEALQNLCPRLRFLSVERLGNQYDVRRFRRRRPSVRYG